ncbi:MAG: hypothetical protein ACTSVI_11795 [Promethearchaeota archaeon]
MTKKLKVDIYVPLSRCACDWQAFMDRVFNVLMPYIKEIDFDTKNSSSDETKKMNLPNQCVRIEGEVFTSLQRLKSSLPVLIESKKMNTDSN